jgi:arylsulfatase A-like enzyme
VKTIDRVLRIDRVVTTLQMKTSGRRAASLRSRWNSPAIVALLAVAAFGCPGAESTPSPSPDRDLEVGEPRLVLLLLPGMLSRAHLAPYAPDVSYTPALAEFAREALVFDEHHSEGGLDGIGYASILTGSGVTRHGVFTHPLRLRESVLHIAEAFAEAGYHTTFYDQHGLASAQLGFAQGVSPLDIHKRAFDADDRYFAKIRRTLTDDPSHRELVIAAFPTTSTPYATDTLAAFCADHPARCGGDPSGESLAPALAFYAEHALELSFDPPHSDAAVREADLTPETLALAIDAAYASRVAALDQRFGAIVSVLAKQELLDETLIALTTDHGELFVREGAPLRWTHGFLLAPETIRVPWLLRGPGVTPGRHGGVTRSIDVFPTLAGLAGVPLEGRSRVEGQNLAAWVRGERPVPELDAFFQSSYIARLNFFQSDGWETYRRLYPASGIEWIWVGLRRGPLLYRWRHRGNGEWGAEAFDLAQDPHETRDVFDPDDPEHQRAEKQLREYKALIELGYAAAAEAGEEVNPVDIEALSRVMGLRK